MDCETCNNLLAAYRQSVTLIKDAARKGSGAIGEDSRLAIKEVERLSQKCKDASDAFMAHWREHHIHFDKSAEPYT